MGAAPDAVIFDLDGTLCEYERDADDVLATTFDRLEVDPPFAMRDFHGRYIEFLRDCNDGRALYERCFVALAEDRGLDAAFGQEVASIFLDERDLAAVRPSPGAAAVLEAFSDRKVGLVTNGHPELQRRKLRKIGAADAFESAVFAGFDTPAKPAPEPFLRATDELDVAPGDALYVGNSLSADVVGAQGAGLQAAFLGKIDGSDVTPEYRIDSLRELLDDPW